MRTITHDVTPHTVSTCGPIQLRWDGLTWRVQDNRFIDRTSDVRFPQPQLHEAELEWRRQVDHYRRGRSFDPRLS